MDVPASVPHRLSKGRLVIRNLFPTSQMCCLAFCPADEATQSMPVRAQEEMFLAGNLWWHLPSFGFAPFQLFRNALDQRLLCDGQRPKDSQESSQNGSALLFFWRCPRTMADSPPYYFWLFPEESQLGIQAPASASAARDPNLSLGAERPPCGSNSTSERWLGMTTRPLYPTRLIYPLPKGNVPV